MSRDERVFSRYRAAVDLTFAFSCPRPSTSPDLLLRFAAWSVRAACQEAQRSGWCRYCWAPPGACFCCDVASALRLAAPPGGSRAPENCAPHLPILQLHWCVLLHPGEFLRSTSTARLAVQCMDAMAEQPDLKVTSELLVYGTDGAESRLDEILRAATVEGRPTCMLFPRAVGAEVSESSPVHGGEPCAPPEEKPAFEGAPLTVEEALSLFRTGGKHALDVTIVVPDGSWSGATALAKEVRRRERALMALEGLSAATAVPCVALDAALVAKHHSPMIEALKSGQGAGRITTLEACGLFLREAGHPQACERLFRALRPLVEYVVSGRRRSAAGVRGAARGSRGGGDRGGPEEEEAVSKWASALQTASRAAPERAATDDGRDAATPRLHPALRFCSVCGENLATPDRMWSHLQGRGHCEAVARGFAASCAERGEQLPEPTEAGARNVLVAHSIALLKR